MTFIELVFYAGIAWACWRFFLKGWIQRTDSFKRASARIGANQISDEAYYEMAGEEIRRGTIRQGLWLKAVAMSDGDENRARAAYLKLRVESMRTEVANTLHSGDTGSFGGATSYKSSEGRVVIDCPSCGGKSRVKTGATLDVRCPHCQHSFRIQT